MRAPGVIECAHWTSSDVSEAQPDMSASAPSNGRAGRERR
jgi:hypothetical protein